MTEVVCRLTYKDRSTAEVSNRLRAAGSTSPDTQDDRQLRARAKTRRSTRRGKHRRVQGGDARLESLRLMGNTKVVWELGEKHPRLADWAGKSLDTHNGCVMVAS